MKELLALLLVAASGLVLYAGRRRGRLVHAYAAIFGALLALWGASPLAVAADYRDADGHMDCWPSCTTYQEAVNTVFWFTIPLLVLVTAGAAIAVGVSALRRRAARPHG